MRVLVGLTAVTCILAANTVSAQDLGTGATGDGVGILASAERVALRTELQPNAGAQRARRGGRLKAGWTLVAVGGGVVLGGMYLLANRESGYYNNYSGTYISGGSNTAGMMLILTGLGVAGLGGVLVARADVSSPVPARDGRPRSLFRPSRTGVAEAGR